MSWVIVAWLIPVIAVVLCACVSRSYCVVKIGEWYAVRRGILHYQYKDFYGSFWWSKSSPFFSDCLTYDLGKARAMLAMVSDTGTKV